MDFPNKVLDVWTSRDYFGSMKVTGYPPFMISGSTLVFDLPLPNLSNVSGVVISYVRTVNDVTVTRALETASWINGSGTFKIPDTLFTEDDVGAGWRPVVEGHTSDGVFKVLGSTTLEILSATNPVFESAKHVMALEAAMSDSDNVLSYRIGDVETTYRSMGEMRRYAATMSRKVQSDSVLYREYFNVDDTPVADGSVIFSTGS